MNTFRMISLQALQATKVAHRPWANLCIIIWANVELFRGLQSRSTSAHTISPFPLSNFRQFFFCIQTCVCFLLLRETMESDFFFWASLVQQKKRAHFARLIFQFVTKASSSFLGGNFLYSTFFTDFLTGKQNCHSLWSTFFHSLLTFLSNQTSKYFPIILEKWIPKGPGFLFRLHKLRETGGILVFPLL